MNGTTPGPTAGPVASRPANPADVTITIILLVTITVGGALASFFGLFLAFMSDSCNGDCNDNQLGLAIIIGAGAPVVIVVVAVVVSIVRLVRRRTAFWVPLVAVVVWVPCIALAIALASNATSHT